MGKSLVPLALGLGAIFLGACFVLPLAFAGGAWARYDSLTDKQEWAQDGLLWALIAVTVVTAFIGFNTYSEAKSACTDIQSRINLETSIDTALGRQRSVNQDDIALASRRCSDLPFSTAG